jgi:hypothetical protein
MMPARRQILLNVARARLGCGFQASQMAGFSILFGHS